MPLRIALVAKQTNNSNLSHLALASLASYLARELREATLSLFVFDSNHSSQTELEILDAQPSVICVWCHPEEPDHGAAVSRISALQPNAVIVLFGPELVTNDDATRQLSRHFQADLAVRGEPESPMLELCGLAIQGRLSRASALEIPGLSARADLAIVHGPAPGAPLPAERLPSPLEAGLVPLQCPPGETFCVEVMRGPIPFSPLPLDQQPGPPRVIAMERLQRDLSIVVRAGIPRIELLSGALDLVPDWLPWVLRVLENLEPDAGTSFRLRLRSAPDSALAAQLRKVGVTHVRFTHPLKNAGQETPTDSSTVAKAIQLLNGQGTRVAIELPLGLPGQDKNDVLYHLDHYMKVPVSELRMGPLFLWPGHGLAQPADAATKSTANTVDTASHEVLYTAELPFHRMQAFKRVGNILNGLLPRWQRTVRLLASVCKQRPSALLAHLDQWLVAHGTTDWTSLQTRAQKSRLLSFTRHCLKDSEKVDRVPALAAVMDLETWLYRPRKIPRPRRSTTFEVTNLEDFILARMPGLEVRTFPYDVLKLKNAGDIEEAALRRTHLLLRRSGARTPWVEPISEMRRALIEISNGKISVDQAIDILRTHRGTSRATAFELHEGFLQLLEANILYVKKRHIPKVSAAPAGNAPRKILPFRPRPVDPSGKQKLHSTTDSAGQTERAPSMSPTEGNT